MRRCRSAISSSKGRARLAVPPKGGVEARQEMVAVPAHVVTGHVTEHSQLHGVHDLLGLPTVLRDVG
jgi:hypothetical protein